MTIDTKTSEVKRLKTKRIKYDKEKLFEEIQEGKIQLNIYKEENVRLKTQLAHLQKEQLSNEALAEELISSQNAPIVGRLNKNSGNLKGKVAQPML